MIDFHSHILPKIDDGSSSSNESIEMLTLTKQQGIGHIVATPHFYASETNPAEFLSCRSASYNRLISVINGKNLPQIIPGAEVSYFEGISDCEELEALKILGTSLIMVEMPMCKWSERMLSELAAIYDKRGLVPLIAHIDRYIRLMHDKKIADRLSGLPVLIQANASFFIEKKSSKLALSMLSKGKIHLLGSDCHNIHTRRPNLGDAIEVINEKLGREEIQKITANEKAVFSQQKSAMEELFI